MLGGVDNPNGELPSYITGADSIKFNQFRCQLIDNCRNHDIQVGDFVMSLEVASGKGFQCHTVNAGNITACLQDPRVLMSCIRVIFLSCSRNSSGAEIILEWIIWRATLRVDVAVLRQVLSTCRDSIIPSCVLGVPVLIPENAACTAHSASIVSLLPRLRRSIRSGAVTSRTSTPAFCK